MPNHLGHEGGVFVGDQGSTKESLQFLSARYLSLWQPVEFLTVERMAEMPRMYFEGVREPTTVKGKKMDLSFLWVRLACHDKICGSGFFENSQLSTRYSLVYCVP